MKIEIELIESLELQCAVLKERLIQSDAEKNLLQATANKNLVIKKLAEKYKFDENLEFRLDERNNTLVPINKEE